MPSATPLTSYSSHDLQILWCPQNWWAWKEDQVVDEVAIRTIVVVDDEELNVVCTRLVKAVGHFGP